MSNFRSRVHSLAKDAFRIAGLDVRFARNSFSEEKILRQFLQNTEVDHVLDVGANAGQYGLLLRKCGYAGPITSFEPLAAAHASLTKIALINAPWTVAPRCALGAIRANASINVAGNSASSSLLQMCEAHIKAAPSSKYVAKEDTEIVPLDDCADQYVKSSRQIMLKIDTQGYEMEVLRGAKRCLSGNIRTIQVELSLVKLYERQPLMLEVCNFLNELEFTLTHIIPGFRDPSSGKLLQFDGIFCKA